MGNWILVTTRKLKVASIVATHPTYGLDILSDDDCWSIFKEKAFAGGEVPKELEELRNNITKRCQGLPLAACVIGGLLRIKRKEGWLPIIESGLLHLSQNENSIMQLLRLSFDHLPTASVKKCFAYLSNFEKDFVLDKQLLIQLWMAEGFLQASDDDELEDIGNSHYHILLESSLLEEVIDYENCLDVDVRFGKMHDFVFDLARSVSRSDSAREDHYQSRYLVLNSSGVEAEVNLNDKFTSVSTLDWLKSVMPGDILAKFRYLRILRLLAVTSEVLPSSISKLIHLRLLEISYSRIRALPESICKLYNLQTLIILESGDQRIGMELPKGMRNLINLRHLSFFTFDSELQMPKGMGQLTSLQTLQFFNVGKGAQQADLLKKPYVDDLGFQWGSGNREDDNDENVLEGLQPHPNLHSLRIRNYNGGRFPQWLMNMAVCMNSMDASSSTRLNKLVKLRLRYCKMCTEVPALGLLPSLQFLELKGLENLKCIGPSFYGIADDYCGSRSSRGSGEWSSNLFPALKTLKLVNMPNLMEWLGLGSRSNTNRRW
ncbi:putative disease resistance RPP13-like protein 1 [Coffea eugenioides]|uniref:putative disease resistance RPP13-like protein 1 n=1 Tax=Coffea eugenioides TaxID=49369 RepID=UPI000F60D71E|nr:putative disease resistance RPP13-like protein 1 [Coffea eugenioides]